MISKSIFLNFRWFKLMMCQLKILFLQYIIVHLFYFHPFIRYCIDVFIIVGLYGFRLSKSIQITCSVGEQSARGRRKFWVLVLCLHLTEYFESMSDKLKLSDDSTPCDQKNRVPHLPTVPVCWVETSIVNLFTNEEWTVHSAWFF